MVTTKRVIVLCDGTWCGRETNTRSNINILSRMIGISLPTNSAVCITSPTGDVCAKYFDGVGLGGDFLDYLWNGAFATKAKKECTEVYKFIVQNFTWNAQVHTEVWLFGISRGAYIVRSVGGMINNCGIIKAATNESLINQIYGIYRSPHAVDHPSSPEMRKFRQNASYAVRSPIKFMGIFDTVGSRGVPKVNYDTGSGFEWPEFYDNLVSSAVEKVYHAAAIHDRFWAFQPCLASRNPEHAGDAALASLEMRQTWFPGCHYDLARQEFQFLREGGTRLERILFPILNVFSNTVYPNERLADLVLLWILRGIMAEGGETIIHKDTEGNVCSMAVAISRLQAGIPTNSEGTGDVYANILSYLPGGRLFSKLIAWWKNLNKTAYAILFEPVDRVIPDPGIDNGSVSHVWNEAYDYTVADPDIGGVIESIAGVQRRRYPSQTYQNYRTYMMASRTPAIIARS
ncbi:hypothetical protein EDB81DRAFT_653804 [Dactylonectria macrodidyma]|uniref:T6SS Phospholipase effector Tle1-like catalytic domain-containing protein n=1 Tax=Dactylonectria macrodidyma TaxID=307937 RepID=A0A9P9ERA2_9HYPO|nr:hypothetical protein EDB81DRAFT_653804 [Dactylonectria macrodidyma]